MKVQADNIPPLTLFLQGGLFINYNVEKKTRQDNNKDYYEYDSLFMTNIFPNRGDIINAFMSDKYPEPGQEIAMLNNYNIGGKEYVDIYNEYQEYRNFAKGIADQVLSQ